MSVILHIDGDSFFASVEASLRPGLMGKAVVTGEERGIATAMSTAAKALGVHRGMPIWRIRQTYPEVIIVPSNYHHYRLFAQRMYSIARRYSDTVEEYSIDECFVDLSSAVNPETLARELKEDLQTSLGMTFSFGIGPTKVLAKAASKHQKPDGFFVVSEAARTQVLRDLLIGKVWGIGPSSSTSLQAQGILTAHNLVERPEQWVEARYSRPLVEIYKELKGIQVHGVMSLRNDEQSSIQQTRTFTSRTSDKRVLLAELSKNIEGACRKARTQNLCARHIYYFLKTQEFRYHRCEIPLLNPLSNPADILTHIVNTFDTVYRPEVPYRATGVTLAGLVASQGVQTDLFGATTKIDAWTEVFKAADIISQKFGSGAIIMGSSLNSLHKKSTKKSNKQFTIPFMGEVR